MISAPSLYLEYTKLSISERKISMENKKLTMSEQEFIQSYRNADAATRYALEQSLCHFFSGKEKRKYSKKELGKYWNERIGEYNAYSKAANTVNNEYAMAHIYIDRADAILTTAVECNESNVEINTIYSLLWVIKDILKSADDEINKGDDRIMTTILQRNEFDEVRAE